MGMPPHGHDQPFGPGTPPQPPARTGVQERPFGSKYILREQLGRGATGRVFRASRRDGGPDVAVKLLREDLIDSPGAIAALVAERDLIRPIDHPNVAKVHGLVVDEDSVGIVMDLVPGGDLRTAVPAPADLLTLLSVMGQTALGLDALHRVGIAHLDLKPENVLIGHSTNGSLQPRICDFGVSRIADSLQSSNQSALRGTSGYIAPEVVDGRRGGPPADVYALGIMVFEWWAGYRPYRADNTIAQLLAHTQAPIPDLPVRFDVAPALTQSLQTLVTTMLAKQPQDRPQAMHVARTLAELTHRANPQTATPGATGVGFQAAAPLISLDSAATSGTLDPVTMDPSSSLRTTRDRTTRDRTARVRAGKEPQPATAAAFTGAALLPGPASLEHADPLSSKASQSKSGRTMAVAAAAAVVSLIALGVTLAWPIRGVSASPVTTPASTTPSVAAVAPSDQSTAPSLRATTSPSAIASSPASPSPSASAHRAVKSPPASIGTPRPKSSAAASVPTPDQAVVQPGPQQATQVPAAVSEGNGDGQDTTSITIVWQSTARATTYRFAWTSPDGGGEGTLAAFTPDPGTPVNGKPTVKKKITGLSPGHIYNVSVYAINDAGETAPAREIGWATLDRLPDGSTSAPADLTCTSKSPTSVLVQWAPQPDVFVYSLRRSPGYDPNEDWARLSARAITGLTPGTTYTFTLTPLPVGQPKAPSATCTVTTPTG